MDSLTRANRDAWNAVAKAHFENYHPQFFYSGYTAYDVEENKRELYPCTFSLKAVAE